MSFVVDASVAIAWSLPDETSDEATAVLLSVGKAGAVAPYLLRLEVANVLSLAVRRRRISSEVRATALVYMGELAIDYDLEGMDRAWSDLISISDAHGLTAYDALYLEVAMRRGLPLATFDRKLQSAAGEAGVKLHPAVSP